MKIREFNKATCIHNKGIIPLAAIHLLDGAIEIHDNSGNIEVHTGNKIIGVHELWNHLPLNVDIYTTEHTVLLYYDKSFLKKFLQFFHAPSVSFLLAPRS